MTNERRARAPTVGGAPTAKRRLRESAAVVTTAAVAAVVLLAALTGCRFGAIPVGAVPVGGGSGEAGEEQAGREWTVVVYMSADNELHARALEDLNEMEAADVSGPEVTVLALVDRSTARASGDGDWGATRLYEIKPDPNGKSPRIVSHRLGSARLGLSKDEETDLNTGSPDTLSVLLEHAAEEYPAEHTALIVWGEGNGYRAVSVDEASGDDPLHTAELSGALEQHPPDVVALDLAFGAQLEIAYELRSVAGTLVASQHAMNLDGWVYDRFLEELARDPAGAQAFGTAAIEAFATERENMPGGCISAVDLSAVGEVSTALDELSTALHARADTAGKRDELRRLLFDEVEAFYRTPGDLNLDLGNLGVTVGENYPEVQSEATALSDALQAAVNRSWCAEGARARASGLSLHYVPVDEGGYAHPPHTEAYFVGRWVSHPLSFVQTSKWVPDDDGASGLLYRLWYESM